MKFCPNCGAQIADGSKFCTECGTKISIPEPVYATPVIPIEEPPTVPSYEPPAHPVYKPPVKPVEEPLAQPTYSPFKIKDGAPKPKQSKAPKAPKEPREKKPVNKIAILFAVVGVLVLLVIGLLIALLSGSGKDAKSELGLYEGVSCSMDGGTVSAEGEWIKLQKNGKAKLYIMDSEFSAKWSLKGETLELEQSGDTYQGTLKNGVIVIDLVGATYTFAKEEEANEPVTYKAVTCISGGQILDEELMDLIGGCYVRFAGDGAGTFYCFGDKIPLTYDDKALKIDGDTMPYTIKGNTMEFTYVDGTGFTLELTEEDLEEAAAADNGWDSEKWEDQEMTFGLPTAMDWIGLPIGELTMEEATVNFRQDGCSGTAWLEPDGSGTLVVDRLDLYLYDMDFLSARDLLIEQFGEPTDEGEEPYAASNGGAVTYCWFDHPAGSLHLSSASEEEFLQITIDTE